MNLLFIIVVCLLAWNLVWGYQKGLMLAVYSLVAWVIVFVIVAWATPFLSGYVIDHTDIDEQIETRVVETLHNFVAQEEDTEGETGRLPSAGNSAGNPTKGEGTAKPGEPTKEEGTAKPEETVKNELAELGIQLPSAVTDQLLDVDHLADEFLETSGIYEGIARKVSHMAINGITFLVVLLAATILIKVIDKALDLVSEIPGISGLNKFGGLLVGGAKGLLLVWLCFAVIALAGATEWGMALTSLIYENILLAWLYENNLILSVVVIFL